MKSKIWIEDWDDKSKGLFFLDHEGKKRVILVYDGTWDEKFIPIQLNYGNS